MADDQTTPPTDVYIESKLPSDSGFGQNGYRGPSSVQMDRQSVRSNYAPPESEAERVISERGAKPRSVDAMQVRTISDEAIPPAHGQTPRKGDGTIPDNGRPVTRAAAK